MNKKIVHDALILFAFTIVLGLVLALVYGITKDPIAKANEATQRAAFQAVFADAANFESVNFDSDKAAELVTSNGYNDVIKDVQAASDESGELLGYVITVLAKDGSQGSITFSVGIRLDGTVNGYSITETGETPGLGLKASEPEFAGQFENKNVAAFTVVKQAASSESEIEAITGSTITSKAVANGCNAAILFFTEELGGGQ